MLGCGICWYGNAKIATIVTYGSPASIRIVSRRQKLLGDRMSDIIPQNRQYRPRGRPFAKGQSGNPAGRRRGCRNKATRAAEAYPDGDAETFARKAVQLALAGNPLATRL